MKAARVRSPDLFSRRRRMKVAVAAVVVGLVMSALVAVGLFYLSQIHSR